jgi:hypothetical protein
LANGLRSAVQMSDRSNSSSPSPARSNCSPSAFERLLAFPSLDC